MNPTELIAEALQRAKKRALTPLEYEQAIAALRALSAQHEEPALRWEVPPDLSDLSDFPDEVLTERGLALAQAQRAAKKGPLT